MRGTRWLLLVAILAVLGGTWYTYIAQRRSDKAHAAPKPPELEHRLSAAAGDWTWDRYDAGKAIVKIRAKAFRQVAETNHFELDGLRMDLVQKDGTHYDLVSSPKADFDQTEGKMLSDGEVEITLDVPTGTEPTPDLTRIKSTGITFESKTGKATTNSATSFKFKGGEGTSVGATYDPNTKELHLLKQVVLNLHGTKPGAKVMRVETEELTYKETGSIVWLTPTAKMIRENSVITAGPSVVNLRGDRSIDSIAAQQAHGVDTYPKRKLDYVADMLVAKYDEDGEHIQKISGAGHPKLISSAEGAETTMVADIVDLDFTQQNNEPTLTHVAGNSHAVIESKQLPDPAKRLKTPETRILRAGYIDMFMRPGGKEIDKVLTQTDSILEFLPNEPDQHRRILTGGKMNIAYGPQNSVQSFSTTNVATQTFPDQLEIAKAQKAKQPPPQVSKTSSVNMNADFDAKSQMKHMKQWDNFLYEEGDRHARAVTALLDNDKNIMDLDNKARIWDASGSTDGDHIQIDQKTGNFNANGHVSTSRMPDQDKDTSSADIFDGDQPIQGRAEHMTSANKNKLVHYEGKSVLWQGSDRIQAEKIDIDRDKQTLAADGAVVTQLIDKKGADENEKVPAAAPAFTIVKALHLLYEDDSRIALYTGGATMNRPGLWVKGSEIRAFLSEKDDDAEGESDSKSRLEKAHSDGDVEIVDSTNIRKRTGTGVHAEYYTDNERVIIRGNQAVLVDSLKGNSRGAELTYLINDDKIVMTKNVDKQVRTHMKRKVSAK